MCGRAPSRMELLDSYSVLGYNEMELPPVQTASSWYIFYLLYQLRNSALLPTHTAASCTLWELHPRAEHVFVRFTSQYLELQLPQVGHVVIFKDVVRSVVYVSFVADVVRGVS